MTKELVEGALKITCRYCGKETEKVWICKLEIPHVTRYIFFCPGCQRCLGVSNDKNPKNLVQPAEGLHNTSLLF
jgi:hypothetical protein